MTMITKENCRLFITSIADRNEQKRINNMKIIKTHTGKIYVDAERKLEFLTVGDYGKENNIKADFLGLGSQPYLRRGVVLCVASSAMCLNMAFTAMFLLMI